MIKRILKKILFIKNEQLVKVYSHPRSGTHFLEAFLARNFYAKKKLSIDEIKWGHWSNRKINYEGNEYGKLFGDHLLPSLNNNKPKIIYIYRDGRSVAYSIWKTPNFLNKNLKGISFHDFLKTPIDWKGSPGYKTDNKLNILEHWNLHVKAWIEYSEINSNVLVISYEDLVNKPYKVYLEIHKNFFENKRIKDENEIELIKKPIGLLPNKAKTDSWKTIFNEKENEYFLNLISKNKYLNDYY